MDFEARKNDGIAELTSEPHLTEKNLASNRSKAKNNVERLKQLQDRLQIILRNNLRDEIDEIGGASILQSEMVSALETHNSAINKSFGGGGGGGYRSDTYKMRQDKDKETKKYKSDSFFCQVDTQHKDFVRSMIQLRTNMILTASEDKTIKLFHISS